MTRGSHFVSAFMLVWIAGILGTNPVDRWFLAVVVLVIAAGHVAEGMRR